MSKFSRLLSKSTSILLTTILFFVLVQLSVFAEEEKTATGSDVFSETGSEVWNIETFASGALILQTNSGVNLLEESSTGGIILEEEKDKVFQKKALEQTNLRFKSKNLSLQQKENLLIKAEQIQNQISEDPAIQQKITNYKTARKSLKTNEKQSKNTLEEINAELKNKLNEAVNDELNSSEKAQIEIEPNYLFELQSEEIPLEVDTGGVAINDPEFPNQWGIFSIIPQNGTGVITNETTENSYAPIIALIDTGVDYRHEDLQGQFWTDANCKNDLGEPIAGGCLNGGYDFVENDNDPYASDGYAHGTQVAGILVAKTNNNLGIASLSNLFTPLERGLGGFTNSSAQLMILRVAEDGILEQEKIIQAIYFAVNNGAKILNLSFGGPTYSENLKNALEYAQAQGVIVFASAGNYANNNDLTPIYPASYELNNIISVTAHDQNDNLASFSDYGTNSVDIAAPGVDILTTGLNNTYVNVSGTSFSTPFVIGGYVYYVNVVKIFISNYDFF